MGKPSKLTDDRRDALVKLIEAGNRLDPACDSVSITYRTHRNWYTRGELEAERLEQKPNAKPKVTEGDYVQYFHAIKTALATAEIDKVKVVHDAGMGGQTVETQVVEKFAKTGELVEKKVTTTLAPPNWTAAAWWLERRMPLEYGKRDTLKVEMEVQAQLEQLFTELRGALSPSALAEVERFVAERINESGEGRELN